MARLLRIPEISAGSTEAMLASWPVAENVPYSAADVIASVETDKAVIDIEAEEDGVILRRLVGEGASVTVGQPIALLGRPGESAEDLDETLRAHLAAPAGGAVPAATEGDGGRLPAAGVAAPPGGNAAGVPAGTGNAAGGTGGTSNAAGGLAGTGNAAGGTAGTSNAAGGTAGTGNGQRPLAGQQRAAGRIFVSPLARRLARDAALDLTAISGTGPGGRIMRRDVESAIQMTSQPGLAGTQMTSRSDLAGMQMTSRSDLAGMQMTSRSDLAGMQHAAGHTAAPHSRVRRAVAARLTESKQTVPHFYVAGTASAGKLLRLRRELNDSPSPVRVSVNDLVIKAVARVHQLVPAMNVTWTPEAMLSYDSVDIGVAIASPRGLVTPVVRSVEQLSISALAAAVADLVARAGAGRLQQRELEGGSTSVTNLGMFGVEQFSAIINPPQSSILAVGAAHDAPVVRKGRLRAGSVIQVTLSADHRAVDGMTAAEWMRAFIGIIEHPAQILA